MSASDTIVSASGTIGGIETAVKGAKGGPDSWNPPFCGDIDMRIGVDGTWYYLGTPIGRKPLVTLFSSVLRREERGYVLVTPVEKVGIRVDDAPFVAVEMAAGDGETLRFRTNVDEWIAAGMSHPLRFERQADGSRRPYLLVRPGLEALVARPVFYELVERGEERDGLFGVASGGVFHAIAPMDELGAGLT
jgi:uncharacterized protein